MQDIKWNKELTDKMSVPIRHGIRVFGMFGIEFAQLIILKIFC